MDSSQSPADQADDRAPSSSLVLVGYAPLPPLIVVFVVLLLSTPIVRRQVTGGDNDVATVAFSSVLARAVLNEGKKTE